VEELLIEQIRVLMEVIQGANRLNHQILITLRTVSIVLGALLVLTLIVSLYAMFYI